jgi:hypothetical protein
VLTGISFVESTIDVDPEAILHKDSTFNAKLWPFLSKYGEVILVSDKIEREKNVTKLFPIHFPHTLTDNIRRII